MTFDIEAARQHVATAERWDGIDGALLLAACDEIEFLRKASMTDEPLIQRQRAEIERLREALRKIVACDYRGNMPPEQEIARAALGEKRNPIAHPTLDEVKRLGYDSLDSYYHDLYDGEADWGKL